MHSVVIHHRPYRKLSSLIYNMNSQLKPITNRSAPIKQNKSWKYIVLFPLLAKSVTIS
jgi:hypothetical protein